MQPYYEADGITIYHGDALDLLRSDVDLGAVGGIVTDPPRKAIGIESVEAYCEIAANRLAQGVLDLSA